MNAHSHPQLADFNEAASAAIEPEEHIDAITAPSPIMPPSPAPQSIPRAAQPPQPAPTPLQPESPPPSFLPTPAPDFGKRRAVSGLVSPLCASG